MLTRCSVRLEELNNGERKIALINKSWLNCWVTNDRFCIFTDNRATLKGKGGRGWLKRCSALAQNELLQQDDDVSLKVMNAFWYTYHNKQGRVEFCKGSLSQPPTKELMATNNLLHRRLASETLCLYQPSHTQTPKSLRIDVSTCSPCSAAKVSILTIKGPL